MTSLMAARHELPIHQVDEDGPDAGNRDRDGHSCPACGAHGCHNVVKGWQISGQGAGDIRVYVYALVGSVVKVGVRVSKIGCQVAVSHEGQGEVGHSSHDSQRL